MAEKAADRAALDDVLSRIESKSDKEASTTTYTGRAVSRGDKTLRLAIETGVISIPLDEITNVSTLGQADNSIVRVEVANIASVKHVIKADSGQQASIDSVRRMASARRFRGGPIILTGDTDTITGGRPDACDDTIVVINW